MYLCAELIYNLEKKEWIHTLEDEGEDGARIVRCRLGARFHSKRAAGQRVLGYVITQNLGEANAFCDLLMLHVKSILNNLSNQR